MPSSRRKRRWCRRARGRVQAGVVGQRAHAAFGQHRRRGIHLAPRQAVDDAAVAAMPVEEVQQLAAAVVLGQHRVADVGAVERTDELARILQRQPFDDLAPGRGVGGRGQRDPRDVRPAFVQQGQLAVLGAEIVAPLRDAMRLVDGEQRDRRAFQQGQEARGQQPLRGDVQQVELASKQFPFDRSGGWRVLASNSGRPRARRAGAALRTWSCISAISGETTMPVPSRSSAGNW